MISYHLEKSEIRVSHVVEGDLGVDPGKVLLGALPAVVHHGGGQALSEVVHALVELAPEELDAHDGEDEPEDQADQEDVEDGGNGVHQGVHHNLERSGYNTCHSCLGKNDSQSFERLKGFRPFS